MSEQEMRTCVEQRIIIKFLSREGVELAEILRRLTAQFAEKTISRTQVYDRHKYFRWPRVGAKWDPCTSTAEEHQWDDYYCDPWDDRRRPPPYDMENYCTRRHIVWECTRVTEKCRRGGFLASCGRSESKPSWRVRKTRHDIEQTGMISWNVLSPAMRRGCTITSRGLGRQARSVE